MQANDKRGAPLARPGLGRQPLDALDLVVVDLGHRRVGLVAPRRAVALVLEIDPGRGPQGLLQPAGTHQGRRPPDGVDLADFLGDGDPALGTHLLLEQSPCENPREFGRIHRLVRRRIQRWGGQLRQVGQQVVPGGGNVVFAQKNAFVAHESSFLASGFPMSLGSKSGVPSKMAAQSVFETTFSIIRETADCRES